jgi:YVTN family beta-propeller protein
VGFGAVWVGATENLAVRAPCLLRVDPTTLRVCGQPGAGQIDVRLAAGAEGLWTTGATMTPGRPPAAIQALRIDPSSGRIIARMPLACPPVGGLALGDGAAWVSANRSHGAFTPHAIGTVWRIDAATGRVTARTRVPAGAGALLVTDSAVWVAGAGAPLVTRLDPRTGALTGTVRVGPRPFALASADDAIWVTDSQDGTVRRINPHTLRVAATIRVGRAPYGIAAHARGLWVAVLGDGAVARSIPYQGASRSASAPAATPSRSQPTAPRLGRAQQRPRTPAARAISLEPVPGDKLAGEHLARVNTARSSTRAADTPVRRPLPAPAGSGAGSGGTPGAGVLRRRARGGRGGDARGVLVGEFEQP